FCVLNTHLDNARQEARERSAALIAARVTRVARSRPVVVTRDFYAAPHPNPVHRTPLDARLCDTRDEAAGCARAVGTFTGSRPPVPDGDRIDWILVTPGVTVHRARLNTFAPGGRFPSDHLPVQASLTLGRVEAPTTGDGS